MTTAIANGIEFEIEEEIVNNKLNLQALYNVLTEKKIITKEEIYVAKKKVSDEFKMQKKI